MVQLSSFEVAVVQQSSVEVVVVQQSLVEVAAHLGWKRGSHGSVCR